MVAVALLVPGSRPHNIFGFVTSFYDSSWGDYFEWRAARGSLRIILICFGLWLLIDGVGLWLLRSRRTWLGNLVIPLCALPMLGLAVGGFYLLKSLF